MTAVAEARSDAKAGWSTHCRRGNFRTCEDLQAKCANPRHGSGGQRPPAPKVAEPAPRRESPTPPQQSSEVARVSEIVWEDPPEPARGSSTRCVLTPVQINAIQANPGRWLKAKTYRSKTGGTSAANRITKGKAAGIPAGVEATGRRVGTGSALYVRMPDEGGAD